MPAVWVSRFTSLQRRLERITETTGRFVAWFSLIMMALTVLIVILRYLFNLGWIAMQESVLYLHGALFTLAAAYTFKADAHVRVDIFYRRFSARHKALVNLLGTLLLMIPVTSVIAIFSWQYVANSWSLLESSQEAGGLPAVFLLKSLILLMAALLLLQALAELIKHSLVLLGEHSGSDTEAE